MWLEGSYVSPMRVITSVVRGKTHLAQVRLGTQLATAYVKAFDQFGQRAYHGPACLRDVLARIHGHPSQRIDDLLPHRWRPS